MDNLVGLSVNNATKGSIVSVILHGSLQSPEYIERFIAGSTIGTGDIVSFKFDSNVGEYKVYPFNNKENKMKKERVKVVKEKFYGFGLPNTHEEKIKWMDYEQLVNYLMDNRIDIHILPEWTCKDIVKIILEKTKVQDVTVCLVLDDADNWARGVTVFNRDEDVYDEAVGRTQARNYALRALKGRIIDRNEFERVQVIETLVRTKCPFTNKGERKPELNMYERGLLFGKDFKEKYGKVRVRWFNTMKLPIIGSNNRVVFGGSGSGGGSGANMGSGGGSGAYIGVGGAIHGGSNS